ncbi:MAG: nodulation protein NfeD [Bacteroidales bacterium]|nr:nodulation protein NfeD [Bacteroidales bacterium]
MKRIAHLTTLIAISLLFFAKVYSNNYAKPLYFSIDLKKNVGSTTWIYIQKGFKEAELLEARGIVVEMNTYGGEVVYADSIRTKILNSDIPVIVFIDNNAASAGALISIACDKIYMRPSATIGAASVVDQTGKKLPDKYQSYMRATMRATAQAHGKDTVIAGNDTTYVWKRDPLIAEGMVDERTIIPNVTDSGKVITFTTEEAIKYGYCDGVANSIHEIIEKELGSEDYVLEKFKPETMDNIKGFLMNPFFQSILIMLIIGGIYFELQSPGIGFALVVAVVAALLYFAPLYIEGLAANWEILLFILGVALIVLEIFAFPGFGVAGISGILLVIIGLILSLIGNVNFDFEPVETKSVGLAIVTVIGGLLLGFGFVLYLSNKIGTNGVFRRLALDTKLDKKEGYIGVSMDEEKLVSSLGTAHTVLRPSGKVKIGNKVYDAVSVDGAFIDKGATVKVVRYETGQVYVESAEH